MNRHSISLKSALFTALGFLGMMASSGCALVNDDTDCVESANLVRFVYDHNMKFTCAFDNEVERMLFFIFDSKTGTLSKRIYVPHADLNENNEMALNMEPGEYDILVWAGTESKTNDSRASIRTFDEDYDIPIGKIGESTLDDFHCYLKRDITDDGHHIRDIINNLYHGRIHVTLPYASPSKPNRVTIPLKKNTNTFRIVLQQLDGSSVSSDEYELVITDSNGWINADNSLRDDETLTYHPWFAMSGSVNVNTNPQDAPGNGTKSTDTDLTRGSMGASLWEFTTSRLDMTTDSRLTIRSKSTGTTVLDISPKDYALLVKGFYNRNMDDQEYLDRQDEYNMTFFLNNGRWASSVIIINDWRIIRNDVAAE